MLSLVFKGISILGLSIFYFVSKSQICALFAPYLFYYGHNQPLMKDPKCFIYLETGDTILHFSFYCNLWTCEVLIIQFLHCTLYFTLPQNNLSITLYENTTNHMLVKQKYLNMSSMVEIYTIKIYFLFAT